MSKYSCKGVGTAHMYQKEFTIKADGYLQVDSLEIHGTIDASK